MDFAPHDARGYRTVDVRDGYSEWALSFEDSVVDAMDIGLFERLRTPSWGQSRRVVDLGCGTGRTGAWLRKAGVGALDGVDLTPQMLAGAQARAVHDRLFEASVTDTGLPDATYDLLVSSLVDEHLQDLAPLYAEAFRISAEGALFVLVGFHPHFMLHTGMPTHYRSAEGEDVAISTTIHLVSDHVRAAAAAGWQLVEMHEGLIDDEWVAAKPKWDAYRGHPISAAYVWSR